MNKEEIYKTAIEWYDSLDEWSKSAHRNIFYMDEDEIDEDCKFFMWYLKFKPNIKAEDYNEVTKTPFQVC